MRIADVPVREQPQLYQWVIEGDIEGCFDNIDHGILMEAVQKRIADNSILWLIRRFLKAPVIEEGIQDKNRQRNTARRCPFTTARQHLPQRV